MNIDEVIILLCKNYKRASKAKYVRKPLSWALHHTWEYVNEIEKEREVKNEHRGQD